jgi:hypothetical protein
MLVLRYLRFLLLKNDRRCCPDEVIYFHYRM